MLLRELKKGSLVLTNLSVSDTFPPIEVKTTLYAEGDPAYISTCCRFTLFRLRVLADVA